MMNIKKEKFGLLVVRVEPEQSMEDEFVDWYDTEHIPERLAVPGFLSARRFTREEKPRFGAFYDVATIGVLDSPEYRVYFEGKKRTPWTARVGGRLVQVDRRIYTQIFPGNELASKDHGELFVVSAPSVKFESLRKSVETLKAASKEATGRIFEIGPSPKTQFEENLSPSDRDEREVLAIFSAKRFQRLENIVVEWQSARESDHYSSLGSLRLASQ